MAGEDLFPFQLFGNSSTMDMDITGYQKVSDCYILLLQEILVPCAAVDSGSRMAGFFDMIHKMYYIM